MLKNHSLSNHEKQEIIRNALSIAGYPPCSLWLHHKIHFSSETGIAAGTKGTVTVTLSSIRVDIELAFRYKVFDTALTRLVKKRLDQLPKTHAGESHAHPGTERSAHEDLPGQQSSTRTAATDPEARQALLDAVWHTPRDGDGFVSGIVEKSQEAASVGSHVAREMKHTGKAIDNSIEALRALLKFLAIAGREEYEVLTSPFWRAVLIVLCVLGCVVNASITIHGTKLLVIIEDPAPMQGVVLLACFPILILFLSKQILTDRMGGGTFLFFFSVIFWCVCLLFNVATTYWVYKVSYRLEIPENVRADVAMVMKEILPLSAALITAIPPILLSILLFPVTKRRMPVK